jgi:hypothetical protein
MVLVLISFYVSVVDPPFVLCHQGVVLHLSLMVSHLLLEVQHIVPLLHFLTVFQGVFLCLLCLYFLLYGISIGLVFCLLLLLSVLPLLDLSCEALGHLVPAVLYPLTHEVFLFLSLRVFVLDSLEVPVFIPLAQSVDIVF